jgi:hypothetical protein
MLRRILALLLVLAALRPYAVAIVRGDYGTSHWEDRELVRGADPWVQIPVAGAELNGGDGSRVPGAALAFLVGVPEALGGDGVAVMRSAWILGAIGLLLLAASARTGAPWLAGGFAACGLAASALVWRSQMTLWNPAWVVPFVVLAVRAVARLVADRDPRWAVPAAAWFAVAAQLHVSAALLAAAHVPGVLLARVPGLARRVPAVVGVVLALYAPFLLVDGAQGWTLTRALGQQAEVGRPEVGLSLAATRGAVAALAGVEHADWSFDPWTPLAGVVLGAAALTACALGLVGRRGREGGADAVIGGAVLLQLLAYTLDAHLEHGFASRYALVLVPSVAWLGGRELARLAEGGFVRFGVGVMLAGLVAVPAWRAASHVPPATAAWTARGQAALFDAVASRLGTDAAGVVARTTQLVLGEDGAFVPEPRGTTFHRRLPGAERPFPGSGAPPCAVIVDVSERAVPRDELATAERIAAALGGGEVVRLERIVPGGWIATWTPAEGRCHPTMSNRYLPTREERHDWAAVSALPCERSALVEHAPPGAFVGLVAWPFAGVEGCRRFPIRVELVRDGAGILATVRSHQLRGGTHNGGMYAWGAVHAPRVELRDEAGVARVVVPVATGRVGSPGELTPLSARAPAVPGTYRVVFVGRPAVGGVDGGPVEGPELEVTLPTTWTLAGASGPVAGDGTAE